MIDLKSQGRTYDQRQFLCLRGKGPLAEGEVLKINLGERLVVGRSRHCDWSLKRTSAYLQGTSEQRRDYRKSLAFRSVSRRHVRITFLAPDMVEIENLSGNGTFLDGHRVDRVVLDDCARATHTLQLGPTGVSLTLEPGSLPLG